MLNVNITILKSEGSVNRWLYIFIDFLMFYAILYFMTKQEIRKEIKNKFKALSSGKIRKESEALCKVILESKLYTSCTTLLAYMPLEDEADIKPVIQKALSQGKKVFLPRVFPDTNQMEFFRYQEDTKTEAGSFGIAEPPADNKLSFTRFLEKMSINEYSPAAHSSNFVEIDAHENPIEHILILVPGRAFTKDGKRRGRGKGFYDIYLSKMPLIFDIKKSGVCLPCQLLTELPATPDDIMMDNVFCGES